MPVPMHYDTAVRLCGGTAGVGNSIQQMLKNKFFGAQQGRVGSFSDREKGYLVMEGASKSDNRTDEWRTYLGVARTVRPWTDGFNRKSSLTSNKHSYSYGGWGGGEIELDGTSVRTRVLKYTPYSGTVESNIDSGGPLALYFKGP